MPKRTKPYNCFAAGLMILGLLGITGNAIAKDKRSSVGTLKIDDKSALVIESSPSLQERKLSTVFIQVNTEEPELAKKIQLVSFDANMPQHFHGMMVKPSNPELMKDEKVPTYQVRGVKLHMPGDWNITVKVKIEGKERELTMPYHVKI